MADSSTVRSAIVCGDASVLVILVAITWSLLCAAAAFGISLASLGPHRRQLSAFFIGVVAFVALIPLVAFLVGPTTPKRTIRAIPHSQAWALVGTVLVVPGASTLRLAVLGLLDVGGDRVRRNV